MKDCGLMRIDHREEMFCCDQMLDVKENKRKNVVVSALGETEEFFVAELILRISEGVFVEQVGNRRNGRKRSVFQMQLRDEI